MRYQTIIKNASNQYIKLFNEYEGNKGNFHHKIKKKFPLFYNFISNQFGKGFNQKIYNYIHNLKSYPICKICKQKTTSFKNINEGYKIYCSESCSGKDKELIERRQKTMKEKYGVPHALQNKTILKKVSEKNKKNFNKNGKGRKTYLKTMKYKYGVSNPMEINEFRNKISDSWSKKSQEEIVTINEKRKKTKLKKYENENYRNDEKRLETLKKRYNVYHPNQIKCSNEWIHIHDKKEFLKKTLPSKHPIKIAKDFNLSFSTIYKLIKKYDLKHLIRKTFHIEYEIEEYIKALGFTTETNNRKILNGKELDIYVPDKKLAVEVNGIYWHSELKGKDKNYHLNKTNNCLVQNIMLLHIFDREWMEKQNVVKHIISSKLNKYKQSIHANDCILKEINNEEKNNFLEQNHLDGIDNSHIRIGLFFKNKLFFVLTIKKLNYNKYEISRISNKTETIIENGLHLSWLYFLNKYKPKQVLIHVNKRYSNGNFLEKLNFKKINETQPNCFYFKSESCLINQDLFNTKKELKLFNDQLSELENLKLNGFNKIWDCGNIIFEWKKQYN